MRLLPLGWVVDQLGYDWGGKSALDDLTGKDGAGGLDCTYILQRSSSAGLSERRVYRRCNPAQPMEDGKLLVPRSPAKMRLFFAVELGMVTNLASMQQGALDDSVPEIEIAIFVEGTRHTSRLHYRPVLDVDQIRPPS